MSSALHELLSEYRAVAKTEREKGTYFEELTRTYLRHEPTYASLYDGVWLLAEVPGIYEINKKDTGIDLVAKTRRTNELHAIQCKFYDEEHVVQKSDIDSFFAASGQKPFTRRIIVTTTNKWGENAENLKFNQSTPVNTIDLHDLESSQIDWSRYEPYKEPTLKSKYDPKPHQEIAISRVVSGLSQVDRGKLIMACGTGKTFTSLKITEKLAGKGKRVLFLVPSLALLSQTLTEWTQQSEVPLHCFAVCSDSQVGKKRRKSNEDIVETFAHELRYPATTDAKRLAQELSARHDENSMSVVFSTYHSIDTISRAQKRHDLNSFDLVICDEAHRTTGATFESEDESAFVRIHDDKHVQAAKRLYMTATPRIYGNTAKAKALQEGITICSMDDLSLYGRELHVISFSEAVELGELTDYKVVVLTIDEDHVSSRLQNLLKDENNQLRVDDAARIVGCWKALCKQGIGDADRIDDMDPMKRAVAFCQVIEPSAGKVHKVSSKEISSMFQSVVEAYQDRIEGNEVNLVCEAEHVDGSMNASEKEDKITWLKAEASDNTCRILSNVRCLSEGVDVPALDAVLFLSPRNSQVDVVQSVGRVMRKSQGKKLGYVVLPVVIPHGMSAKEALDDNKVYRVVWEVLQALRSHDDRFDAFVNKLDLMNDTSGRMEVVSVTDSLSPKSNPKSKDHVARGTRNLGGEVSQKDDTPTQRDIEFQVGDLERALHARLVKKCGNRLYWEEWASDIAKIAQTHISRITAIISDKSNKKEIRSFNRFASELRDDLNDSITDDEVIEMLAQHLVTKPVFDALFADYSFASSNPVSKGMQNILDLLQEHRLDKEVDTLEQFYASVRRRADGIDKAEGKQRIVVELYDKFFRNAFPRMTERLGIVYTPVEVVDFIIHSVNDILWEEFGQTLGSEDVHILDPFVGTGTFITRLMQIGLITPEQLPHKFKNEIHCNEIVLLAYYIAAINIEAVYHSVVGGDYKPFEGILLTDTFQMYESDDLIDQFFPDNSERRKRQKKLPIRVIVGNPPYASADKEETGVKATSYAGLDGRIASTYVAAASTKMGKSKIYDSYIRAIRWASDRVGKAGVVAYVTNASFLDANTADGIRKCLADEFEKIYVFHLRGNQRTSGERSLREGGKVFGSGSRAPIAITVLIKKENSNADCEIRWHDIGDYLSREEKLQKIEEFRSIVGITTAKAWQTIVPDTHNDWINQRDSSFDQFILIGDKKKMKSELVFRSYSMGVKSNRDNWVYNGSKSILSDNIKSTINFYNSESKRIQRDSLSDQDLERDHKKIKWTSDLASDAVQGKKHSFDEGAIRRSIYRPFTNQWSYFDPNLNWTRHLTYKYFPNRDSKNLVIIVPGRGSTKGFCALITDKVFDLEVVSKGQAFPLFLYDDRGQSSSLFGDTSTTTRIDGITDKGLLHFKLSYGKSGDNITKEDLFYYIYALLHSPEYCERYKDNLSKELPRIPAVKEFENFEIFSQAGRSLAHWHVDFETVECYPVTLDFTGGPQSLSSCKAEHFYVRKMKFPKVKAPESGKRIYDKTTVIFNDFITIRDIPLEAYEYVVNGKSAIEWIMERQAVTTDKKSGITNDANLWATETMNSAAYPLDLLKRIITVSLNTNKIVSSLPTLEI